MLQIHEFIILCLTCHDLWARSKKAYSIVSNVKIHELLQFKRVFLTDFDVEISSNYLQLHNLTKWGHMHHVSADWNGEFQF